MYICFYCSNILYDTDGEEIAGLPSEMIIKIREEEYDEEFDADDYLCNVISDRTGWCVLGFEYDMRTEEI